MPFQSYLKPQKRTYRQNNGDPFVIRSGRYKNGKLDSFKRPSWSEDVFISDNSERETIGRSFDLRKLPYLTVFASLFLLLIFTKTAWLQIAKGDYYYAMAEGNRIRVERIEAKRGIIYDRNYLPLVRNKANFLLYVVPADLPRDKSRLNNIFNELSQILPNFNYTDAQKKVEEIDLNSLTSYLPVFLADNIPYETAMLLYLKTESWPGVVLTTKIRREYMYSGSLYKKSADENEDLYLLSLSHILGYTGKINAAELKNYGNDYLPIDYVGKMGVESFWESELRGQSGKKQIEVDALGKEKKIIDEIPPEDGKNLVLSLDVNVQLKTEQILLDHLSKLGLTRASVIILDPRNGEIISLVSLPAYNNNVFARGITVSEYKTLISHPDRPLFNRAISGEYPSGSTIKPIISAAALQEGIISERTKILSTGGIKIGQWFFPDWRMGGHGLTDVRRAISQSVNTFYYYIGGGYKDFKGLGVERIDAYARLFGLGVQSGIDLAGEASGLVPDPEWKKETKGEKWYIGDTYHLAIGQGDILVTPLQVADYTAVFANGGSLYRPHLIRQFLSADDKFLAKVENVPVRKNFIDNYNIEIVRQGMRQGVVSGSSRRLSALPVAVAGKTGTAQWSSKKPPHAWFTGFAPYKHPEIVITVLIEQGGEGSDTAVPVAQDILKWYFGEYKKIILDKTN